MLVILTAFPIAAPRKALFPKEFVGGVVVVNLVSEGSAVAAVSIGTTVGRLDVVAFHAGIVARIQVDGQSAAVLRHTLGAPDGAEIKGACVVGLHRTLVVGTVVVHQNNALYLVIQVEELSKYPQNALGNTAVYHHFAALRLSAGIAMQQSEIAQFGAFERAIGLPRLALHAPKNVIAQWFGREKAIDSDRIQRFFTDDGAGFPCRRLGENTIPQT